MSSIFSPTSHLRLAPLYHRLGSNLHLQSLCCCFKLCHFLGGRQSSVLCKFPTISPNPKLKFQSTLGGTSPANEGTVSAINFEDLMEKDWSFLEHDDKNSKEQHNQKQDQIISAGEVGETSRVLISIGSEEFVDKIFNSSPCEQLLVVHDSLFILASIKEKYDKVKCWQGELIYLPEKWAPFEVVFLYFLPALPFQLGQILGTLAKHCLPGARVVISHVQGRQMVQEQQKQYPDVVAAELPDKTTLQDVAADNTFELVKFVDEPGFYLAVLKFQTENLVR
ncbi:uncharacterized protein LOC113775176 [Coffea eugenioides]|uniref:uncharacterized protein LOC113775176 n=1 Tax=Coffea eugenioides TaxID=49369 RepID=UPI000F615565|nr:uncharacterized protein LOC113775176 [Coffea eugenioides]